MITLYSIAFKETGEPLTPESFKKYWPNYGRNDLYGWRPPKKVYYSLGNAKKGFVHIPDELKPKLVIAEFTMSKIVEDGSELAKKQAEAKFKLEKQREIAANEYRISELKRQLELHGSKQQQLINELNERLKQKTT